MSAAAFQLVGLALTAAGGVYSAVSSYQQGKAARKESEAQAKAQAELASRQAAAQEEQAQEYERQAAIERQGAGIEQLQGEQEADRRNRARALEIGAAYANAAGNGVLVDAGGSFGDILKATDQEAVEDLSIIRANTAMSVWGRNEAARSNLFQATQARRGAAGTLYSGREALRSGYAQGRNAYRAGVNSAVGTGISASGQFMSGYAKGASTYGQSGKASIWNPLAIQSDSFKG